MKTKWTAKSLVKFEETLKDLFLEKKINCPLHLSGGNEEELIRIFGYIKESDYVFSTHRSHYHYLLKGGDELKLIDELYGYPSGLCRGQGRSMHLFDYKLNFFTSAIVGGCPAIACGVALHIQKTHKDEKTRPHVWCFIGDGGEDTGHFMEAVRFSNGRKLPLTYIIEDNDLSINTTKEDRWKAYIPVDADRIIRYSYTRKYPHVGVGQWVSF